ncbi:unnamed protein product [Meloidogyne enterolobii]|uniref:Uncharacterized protein n=1 Tax=Meloidogyne enterolobii TaxID=390850 RepID=A0ACB0YXX1_MELEN
MSFNMNLIFTAKFQLLLGSCRDKHLIKKFILLSSSHCVQFLSKFPLFKSSISTDKSSHFSTSPHELIRFFISSSR